MRGASAAGDTSLDGSLRSSPHAQFPIWARVSEAVRQMVCKTQGGPHLGFSLP